MQDSTYYFKNTITLKSGKQIEICTQYPYSKTSIWKGTHFIIGFVKNPLFVEKTVKFKYDEVAAIESIKDSCIAQVIPWPETEMDPATKHALKRFSEPDVVTGQTKVELEEPTQDGNKPLVEHKLTCAIHNNPDRAGFASEVSDCDCGAIVACAEEHNCVNSMHNDNDQGHH